MFVCLGVLTASCLSRTDCGRVKNAHLEDNNCNKIKKEEMKDESSYMYLHRQLGMQVSSCSETGNNPHTYTCVDLYMASPLEKSRELEVLISHRIRTALPLAPAGQ